MNLISYKFSSEIKCLPNVNLREHMCNEQFPTVNLMINFICECCSSPYINFFILMFLLVETKFNIQMLIQFVENWILFLIYRVV